MQRDGEDHRENRRKFGDVRSSEFLRYVRVYDKEKQEEIMKSKVMWQAHEAHHGEVMREAFAVNNRNKCEELEKLEIWMTCRHVKIWGV